MEEGSDACGPPVSIQSSTSASWPIVQETRRWPVSLESAPYLAALVASSCSASAMAWAVAGSIATCGPSVTMRSR